MKKFISIIKFIPFINLLSFFLMAIPIPIIYGIDRKTNFKTFIKFFIYIVIFMVLLNFFEFKNEIINKVIMFLALYGLGMLFSIETLKCIENCNSYKQKEQKD